ncbi:MAG: Re/Si-specific NAD(P)(+) transhydrogenase subunit alpha [Burkholderiales bacterium]
MRIAIAREAGAGEARVAATPETVKRIKGLGAEVVVQAGAGIASGMPDADYEAAGAVIAATIQDAVKDADVVLKVRRPTEAEARNYRRGALVIAIMDPFGNEAALAALADAEIVAFAMELMPRITRAQVMDVLSSQANLAGYRAVVEAASFYGRFFTGQMTAAGKVPAAKVLVIGAGVAGLAAIGAARGMGAIVRAFDTRPTVKEQVKSMGAEFIELNVHEDGEGAGGYAKEMSPAFIKAEMEMFAAQAKDVDIIITTALIPGRPAPKLIPASAVAAMRGGSVIVDLAAETGGNCELTSPGEEVVREGVTIVGLTNLPSTMAHHASQLYARNVTALVLHLAPEGELTLDFDDEITAGACVTRREEVTA